MHFISDFSYIVGYPLARAGLGPAFPSEIPARRMASILRMRLTYRRMTLAALLAAARRLYIAFHFGFRASLHANSNARVLDCFSGFPDLLYLSFFFQCREIPSRCCVRDMQKFLHFVVGDFAFRVQRFHDFI